MTQPADTIRAPVGFDPVPEKKMFVGRRIPIAAALLKQDAVNVVAAAFMPKRRVNAEQVGVLVFKNLEEYKEYLSVGKHLVHSSPCVKEEYMTWRHALTYEEWSLTSGKVDGRAPWEYKCRRYRKPKPLHGRKIDRKSKPTSQAGLLTLTHKS